MALFGTGALKDAFAKFEAVCAMIPLASRSGGQATLQKAIVLDSLGCARAPAGCPLPPARWPFASRAPPAPARRARSLAQLAAPHAG